MVGGFRFSCLGVHSQSPCFGGAHGPLADAGGLEPKVWFMAGRTGWCC
jgi:hypothetical protein